ncbi:HAD family hydrolase [Butyrivibrio sp. FCS014]|uniref:HAD family hydrolase n=1 Tax=Butyrivibrio sp. FCS014 TaxID=1408304 RepID=UPI00046661F1|nr:HAD family phosphatase [Butyrivibrio sp. FCS014]
MKDFDAVVFDMDGVIFDSEKCVLECWEVVAQRHSFSDIEEVFLACTGTNDKKTKEIVLEAFGQDFPYDEYAKESSVLFHEKYDNGNLPLKPGIFHILDFLKAENKKIALASSTRKEIVTQELRDAGLLHYFDKLVCGDMISKSKPDPEIYLKACKEIGVSPERAYAIEDSYNGIRAAHAGKLKPIMVPDLLPADDEMKSLAEAVIDNLDLVIDYLKD